ncbi:hypothetical protein MPTK1_2g25880 [Marchantia polymorpha subsp. ruderalis]|uniref:HMA domain-containing protein n=1 Tax=Marchantia polymorpha TaxID=3197 RepID=A0A2R6XBE5_MARPO|nr:hypothetical protein MARPO_0025s0091 [Marchantia polymorpha]BBN03726.1 hypothetical protein Mp_2g25880 [Marchantia polymorpha subsp. ruderalis]|eukprot:PTQ43407.1 hypothetical protein MARPO_0025s0091 [Marchantia polymorpha]
MAAFHAMSYGGYDPGWIVGRSVFHTPMTFDRHSQFYNSRGWPRKSGEVSGRVPSHAAKTQKVVDLAIPICCDDFLEKVQKKLGALEGVTAVDVDRMKQKVTVKGKLKIEEILYQAQAIKSNATIWED